MIPPHAALAGAFMLLAGCGGSGSSANTIATPVATSQGGLSFCASLATAPGANGAGSENGQACQVRRAADIVKEMGQGWNLGNTLDAYGNSADPLADETNWGNPKASKALVDAVRKAGFTTLRVPVSWDDHMSGAARTIDPAWMDRVETVARYALDDGMTVILNIHHNKGWEAPTLANEANAKDTLAKLWTQIAARFARYDHHLVFEAMNEPRVAPNGIDDWVGKAEYYDVLTRARLPPLRFRPEPERIDGLQRPAGTGPVVRPPEYALRRQGYSGGAGRMGVDGQEQRARAGQARQLFREGRARARDPDGVVG